MVIAQFENLKFEISSSTALLLNNIRMSAECETEDQTDSSQQYVSAKNGKPLQVTFTAIIDANLGGDVRDNVTYMLNGAQRSLQGYFYIAGTKVFPFKLMLVKAETEEVKLSPSGKWVKTNVNITLKQSTKDWITGSAPPPSQPAPQSTGGGGGGGGGATPEKDRINTTPVKASVKTTGWLTTAVAGIATGATVAAGTAWLASKTTTSTAAKTTSTAAAVSSAAKTVSTAKTTATTVAKTTSSVVRKVGGAAAKIASAAKKK